ncbi:MAG: DUF3320 domain-containing protein [Verrucomicrobia bacterium]|nr:DUF3320 domain-containing protein [Verrucomicrobiota bacterium]
MSPPANESTSPQTPVRIHCIYAGTVSAAFHQNAVPFLAELALESTSDLHDVVVTLTSDPPFLRPETWRLDQLSRGRRQDLPVIHVRLDAGFLGRLTEGLVGSFTLTISANGAEATHFSADVRLLPPSHWTGARVAPALLAAFVRPNEPAIDSLLHRASGKLAEAGRPTGIDGYGSGRKARVWEIAEAIWAAVSELGLTYVYPPASFEEEGQKVRSPGDLLEHRVGTCLDTSVLLASCFEQAGLYSALILVQGHAFVGVALQPFDNDVPVVWDVQALRKRRDLQELILIESTLLTEKEPVRFTEALRIGGTHLEHWAPAPFQLAVDVAAARRSGIRPLELGDRHALEGEASNDPSREAPRPELTLDPTPTFLEDGPAPERPVLTGADRLESWKRRLLDLTLRNKLLNFGRGTGSVTLFCPDASELEDALAAGKKFKIRSLPDASPSASSSDPVPPPRYSGTAAAANEKDPPQLAFERGELFADTGSDDLENRLTELYRKTRTAFEEGGANVLYLAFGFLRWCETKGSRECRAPILLVPVALERKSVLDGFRLASHEDEPQLNPTLMEMLRQDFRLEIPELERELPRDLSGLDVPKILHTFRQRTRDFHGWEVSEEISLSTFSFTKHLMWCDLQERADKLKENALVRHLIDTPRVAFADGAAFPRPEELDRTYPPQNVFAPLPADSSQLAAVFAASAGKNFVLFGPPGTGKSQTITNVIAQCLAEGKTVLFVSHKTAALEVVQRRLCDIGLGDRALELHSNKAQKSLVLARLKQAWLKGKLPPVPDWPKATAELAKLREELNGFVRALHRTWPNGDTPYRAFGRLVARRGLYENLTFAHPMPGAGPNAEGPDTTELGRELTAAARIVGDFANHPLREWGARAFSPAWNREVHKHLTAALGALDQLDRAVDAAVTGLALPKPAGCAGVVALTDFCVALGGCSGREAELLAQVPSAPDANLDREMVELSRLQAHDTSLAGRLQGSYQPTVLEIDVEALTTRWSAAGKAFILSRIFTRNAVRKVLAGHASGPLPADLGPDLSILAERRLLDQHARDLTTLKAVFGNRWAGLKTDLAPLRRALELQAAATRLLAALPTRPLPEGGNGWSPALLFTRWQSDVAGNLSTLPDYWKAFNGAWSSLCHLVGADPTLPEPWADCTRATLVRWQGALSKAPGWLYWNEAAGRVSAAGFGSVVRALAAGMIRPDEVTSVLETVYTRWWVEGVMAEEPALAKFFPERHEDLLARFQQADAAVQRLSTRMLQAKLGCGVPDPNDFGKDPEWGVLSRELQKKARHLPLRRLFEKIPNALVRLTPCLMMSPLSVAQYLSADAPLFDLVIFDEASQIPVWDAIGALARGRQALIVGDPEQLPPATFGERTFEEADDAEEEGDQESILDECLAANVPRRSLRWHYRSRHESLITFSNQRYYNGELVTFPSAVTADRAVRYVHVPGGVYERGGARVNREEARQVTAEVVRRLRDPAFVREKRSLGVVTFNAQQQRLIENLLDAERRQDPALESFFQTERWHEPVFVKNLENVQGDERDLIIFSVAVGPDGAGRVHSTISSLNRQGGHRRLNVAVTRARAEMLVFATLRPEMIDAVRLGNRGITDFKAFLEYSQRGPAALAQSSAPTGRETESPFEDAVQEALQRRGWTLHPQVGVSGFRIDFGVVHPDEPGRYLAGIECDGATYHRQATARDRDRLREGILTGMGWRIRRIWSTEWWQDAEAACERLDAKLQADLAEDRAACKNKACEMVVSAASERDQNQAEADVASAEVPEGNATRLSGSTPQEALPADPPAAALGSVVYARLPKEPLDSSTQEYQPADLPAAGFVPLAPRFHDPLYGPTLRAMVAHVVEAEGPILDRVLIKRLARAHGFKQCGSRIRGRVLDAVDPRCERTVQGDAFVIWPAGLHPSGSIPFRRALPGVRPLEDIPDVELVGLATALVDGGLTDAECIAAAAEELGIIRLSKGIEAKLMTIVQAARDCPTAGSEDREAA